jgi:hypothetical protein
MDYCYRRWIGNLAIDVPDGDKGDGAAIGSVFTG